MRAFIAVELPPEVKKNIAGLVGDLKRIDAPVKWVEPENLHITLKFLGEVEESKIEKLIALVSSAVAGTGSFNVKFEGIGKYPRVIWVGTGQGAEELCKIASAVEKNLAKAGYQKEEREFKPHITIGRVKDQSQGEKGVDELKEKIRSLKDPKFGAGMVDRILVMQSTLTPNGPIYEKIKEVSL